MKHFFLTILTIFLLTSCEQIAVRTPILKEKDGDMSNISKKYWLKYKANDLSKIEDAFELINVGEMQGNKRGSLWAVKNNSKTFYFRFVEADEVGHYIVEGMNLRAVNTFIPIENALTKVVVNSDSKITIYEPRIKYTRLKELAKQSPHLKEIQSFIKYTDNNIIFDEIACAEYRKEIYLFVKSIPLSYFRINCEVKSTNNPNLVKAIWEKQERENREAEAAAENRRSNFYSKFSVGDTWVLDTGWGILGYEDIIIVELAYGKSKDIKVRNMEDYKTEWVSSSKLLTEKEATNNKYKAANNFLEYLNKN